VRKTLDELRADARERQRRRRALLPPKEKDPPYYPTPENLRRLNPNISLGQLARATGYSIGYMSRLFKMPGESSKRVPSFRAALTICKYLDVSLDLFAAEIGLLTNE
jgi:AraC-like DNA-binding protein